MTSLHQPDVAESASMTWELTESVSRDLHARLHWDGIRAVCRNRSLQPEARRKKLRFFLDGLQRSRLVAQSAS
ncbi:MAG TPA: hypothetical protein VGA56_17105 [Opitutaceae bacterium]